MIKLLIERNKPVKYGSVIKQYVQLPNSFRSVNKSMILLIRLSLYLLITFTLSIISGCRANYRMADNQVYDPCFSYICTRDSGGLLPFFIPLEISVDKVTLIKADRISNNVLYAVQAGKHDIDVYFKAGPAEYMICNAVPDTISKSIDMKPGIAYLFQPRAYQQYQQPLVPGGTPYVAVNKGYVYELKSEIFNKIKNK